VEKEKFVQIISENQNLIFKICNSYCSDQETRKDLEQEILMQLWQSFGKFDGRVKITTWMYRVALNTAISYYRKNSKQSARKVDLDISIISIPDIEYDHQTDEKILFLYKVIERLNKMDKALVLLYLDNQKYSEISEILGISESNVSTKISRIKKFLKEQISNY
jgi:RNA polymerase sigma factor (sigma-70 family)